MCPWSIGGAGSRMHVYSPWAFASLPGLEQVLLFPVHFILQDPHLDVTIFEKLNCEAELGAFNQTPTVPCEWVLLVLTTLCSHWLAWTLYRLQVPQWMQQNGWMRGKPCVQWAASLGVGDFVYSMASSTSVGMLSTEGHKGTSVFTFQNTTGRIYGKADPQNIELLLFSCCSGSSL